MRVLSIEEAKTFQKFALPTMYGSLFAVLITTGMRQANASASSGRTSIGNGQRSVLKGHFGKGPQGSGSMVKQNVPAVEG